MTLYTPSDEELDALRAKYNIPIQRVETTETQRQEDEELRSLRPTLGEDPYYHPPLDIPRGQSVADAAIRGLLSESDKIIRQLTGVKHPLPREEVEEKLGQLFPTQDKFFERGVEKSAELGTYPLLWGLLKRMGVPRGPRRIIPGMKARPTKLPKPTSDVLSPEGELIEPPLPSGVETGVKGAIEATGVGTAGFLSQFLEEKGWPGWAVTGAEILPQVASGVAKAFAPGGPGRVGAKYGTPQYKLLQEGRRLGLTNEQMVPLLQEDAFFRKKLPWLSKLANRETTGRAAEETRRGLGGAFEGIKNSPEALGKLQNKEILPFLNALEFQLEGLSNKSRDLISGDVRDLLSRPINGETIINFWQDINSYFNEKHGRSLGVLKGPLQRALRKINPQLERDFNQTNSLAQRYYRIGSRLSTTGFSEAITSAEGGALLYGVVTGNRGIISHALGAIGGREFTAKLLTSPRLQNLTNKLVTSINRKAPAAAQRVLNNMISEIEEDIPEAAKELRKLNLENLYASSNESK